MNKTDSDFIGSFKLVISCKIFVGILNWCESVIKRNLNCSIIVVIKCFIFLRTCRNTVSVGCKKFAVDTVFVFFLSVLYLFFLNVKLLVCSFKMCCYNSSYINRLLVDSCCNLFLSVIIDNQSAYRIIFCVVVIHRKLHSGKFCRHTVVSYHIGVVDTISYIGHKCVKYVV